MFLYAETKGVNMTKKDIENTGLEELSRILCEISNEEEMVNFIKEIMTEKECFDLGLRWKLIKAIYQGETQRKIASDYKISLCKITRGSKILKKEGSCSKRLLDKYYGEDGKNE